MTDILTPPVASTSTLAPSKRTQKALILRAAKERYEVVEDWALPALESPDEVLIEIRSIGLNPVDWKSADYNFALPTLPAVNGRDLAGIVVAVGDDVRRLKVGDRVFGPSTQYRDYRTSAFQSYAVSREHCLGVVPVNVSLEEASAIGVGAVTAALALGSSLGIKMLGFAPRDLAIGAEGEEQEWVDAAAQRRSPPSSPMTQSINDAVAAISALALETSSDNAVSAASSHRDEWIVIWGASAVTGFFAIQFAKLAGMRVVAVCDVSRHAERLQKAGADVIVDRTDPAGAILRVKEITQNEAHYALDCVGKSTCQHAIDCLDASKPSFAVGLSGMPKEAPSHVKLCAVPIKTFHTNPQVGSTLMRVIEELLVNGRLKLPPIEVQEGGLGAINDALDRLRKGDMSGGRLVVKT